MASYSSMCTTQVKHDVFLSFRGEDTRSNFTSHLYAALRHQKIETFIDNNLTVGEKISQSILNAIEESRCSVIIFSKGYASSRWCLEELVKVLQCKHIYGQMVIPVFYHVDPSHVRNQTGTFGDGFAELEESFKGRLDLLERWRNALREAANLSGWLLNDKTSEAGLVKVIVNDILNRLWNISSPSDNKYLVGVESTIKEIVSLLDFEFEDVCSIGIWGIGGIGKTTIARAVFNKILCQFQGFYFAENVREESKSPNGLIHLREKLHSSILGHELDNLGCLMSEKRLGRIKVLIVLDDVTSSQQIEYLIDDFRSFGSGSRIIITSRDKQVLKTCRVNNIYEVKRLSYPQDLQLFGWYAFNGNFIPKNYMELSHKVVTYTKGLPLALKILGSSLFSKEKEVWESAINKLEKGPPSDVFKVLKVSYDGLDKEEQDIFLDIACFFKGENINSVIKILNACDFSTKHGISVLIDKHLITLSSNIVTMHDLLQEMGREIVREESRNNIGKCSRLWHHKDIFHMLTKNKGTKAIQGIRLDLSKTKEINLNCNTFAKICSLRFFDFCCSYTQLELNYSKKFLCCSCNKENSNKMRASQQLKFSSTDLTYFRWHGYPLKSLPSKFHPNNLIALVMPHSKVKQLWTGIQHLDNLRHINLSYSEHLTKIPNLSLAPNLESLILQGCTSLIEICSSIQILNKLVILHLKDCKSLYSLPSRINSKSLENVNLSGCSNLKTAPMFPFNVKFLYLDGTAITDFPFIEHPSRLDALNLEDCSRFDSRPSTIRLSPLKILDLTGCRITELPNSLGHLYSIEKLYLYGNNFERIPADIKNLSELHLLHLGSCKRLRFLPELPKGLDLYAYNCISLEDLSDLSYLFSPKSWVWRSELNLVNCFKLDQKALGDKVKDGLLRIQQCGDDMHAPDFYRTRKGCICFPGNEIPDWFSYKTKGSSMTIELPPDWNNKKLLGFAMCVVVEFQDHVASDDFFVSCSCKTKSKDGTHIEERFGYLSTFNNSISETLATQQDHVFLGFYLSMREPECVTRPLDYRYVEIFNYDNRAYIEFRAFRGRWSREVKKCGIYFVYADDCGKAIEGTSKSFNYDEMEEKEEIMEKSSRNFDKRKRNHDEEEEKEERQLKRQNFQLKKRSAACKQE